MDGVIWRTVSRRVYKPDGSQLVLLLQLQSQLDSVRQVRPLEIVHGIQSHSGISPSPNTSAPALAESQLKVRVEPPTRRGRQGIRTGWILLLVVYSGVLVAVTAVVSMHFQ